MYHFRDILHYLLTHSVYRMWYFVYHLCEVVCLMHNHLLCMYQKWYITYHKVVCNRTKLPILKKANIPSTVKLAPHVTLVFEYLIACFEMYCMYHILYIATVVRAILISYNKWYKWYNMLYSTQIKLYRVVLKTKHLQLVYTCI